MLFYPPYGQNECGELRKSSVIITSIVKFKARHFHQEQLDSLQNYNDIYQEVFTSHEALNENSYLIYHALNDIFDHLLINRPFILIF